jgi:putative restriction endonuclease
MVEDQVRLSAFKHLEDIVSLYGDVLPYNVLQQGFIFKGERITLMGPSGIWKPQILEFPLSITTSPNSVYSDGVKGDFIKYKYRGNNVNHRDNVGLRELIKLKKPLIYFFGIETGKYLASWPAYIVSDNMSDLEFSVAIDNVDSIFTDDSIVNEPEESYRRKYLTGTMKVRIHQRLFRERVLSAYQNHCALCNLKHRELLDAAHIIGDKEGLGDPIVKNGLALCKIHHAAYDQNILGINPDYKIKIRQDILLETDGPMLKYGIQLLENKSLILPKDLKNWPDKNRLATRFELFLNAG